MTAPGPAAFSETHDAISERAADFFERRRFGEWSGADQAELDAWFVESILHEVAYLRLEGAVAHTEELAVFRPFRSSQTVSGGNGEFRYRRFVIPFLAAASLALFAALGIPLVTSLLQPPDRTYSTQVGGRTLLNFADHTQIALNTDTVVRFRMTGSERTVWLEKGEAWFDVSHNAANPFTVIVGKHRVTDIGTEFLIRRDSGGTEVALLNGRATLSTDGAPTTMLAPGDDAIATPVSVSVTRKTSRELADALAWRRGTLVFRNTRLADAVREFNRYNATKVMIADPSIAGLTFSAEIKDDNLEGFLQLAKTMLNLRADWEANGILLARESGEKAKRAVHVKHGP
jgi:transmembrane sensor